MNKNEIAKKYINKIQNKWSEIVETRYLCYESNTELASEIIYKLFNKDSFNEITTYCKYYNQNSSGYTFKVLCEIEENIYFQFDIITRYGVDIPQRIANGKFRILSEIPKGWLDIWELWEDEQDESEV